MKYFSSLFLFLLLIFANWSCSRQSHPPAKAAYQADGQYDTGPPVQGASSALDKISQSIYRLNIIAFYASYTFDRSAHITLGKFKKGNVDNYAVSHTVSDHSVLGTASVVYVDNDKAALLTCAHVVSSPDTVITYFPDSSGIIRNISIKIKQKNYVVGLNNPNLKLIATDDVHDLVLLKATIYPEEEVRVMPFPVGKSSDLDWGTFIYVMGFPHGQKMAGSGIVSKSENNKDGFFLTNAIFNRGISGGPVFALRGSSQNFEWVGIARSSSVSDIFYLEPDINNTKIYSKSEPYVGELLINKKKVINYGVTFSVSMKEIIRFVRSIKSVLEQQGFDTHQFFYHRE
jgi:S1-C subfamily serine protease